MTKNEVGQKESKGRGLKLSLPEAKPVRAPCRPRPLTRKSLLGGQSGFPSNSATRDLLKSRAASEKAIDQGS